MKFRKFAKDKDRPSLVRCMRSRCEVSLNPSVDWTYPVPLKTKNYGDLYLCASCFVEFKREGGDKRSNNEILGYL